METLSTRNGHALPTAYKTGPNAGPNMVEVASTVSFKLKASDNCSASTILGMAENAAILKKSEQVPSIKATNAICTNVIWWNSTSTRAMLPNTIARNVSHTIITYFQFHRSTSAPAGKPKTTSGTVRMAVNNPASAGECVSASNSNGYVTREICVPTFEIACPL